MTGGHGQYCHLCCPLWVFGVEGEKHLSGPMANEVGIMAHNYGIDCALFSCISSLMKAEAALH